MQHKLKLSAAIMLLLCSFQLMAQNKSKPEVKANFNGMAFLATDGDAFYFNFGGPGIKMNYKKWMVSANMLPSLRFIKDDPRPLVTPSLGAGLMVAYKRIIVGVPVYYIAAQTRWRAAVGIGVKIGK